MGVLEGLKPERVFYYFEEICKIPHGSYNVAAISDYCVSVAQSRCSHKKYHTRGSRCDF